MLSRCFALLSRHPPCALSSKRIKRFQEPKTSVAALFARKRAVDGSAKESQKADNATTAAVEAGNKSDDGAGAASFAASAEQTCTAAEDLSKRAKCRDAAVGFSLPAPSAVSNLHKVEIDCSSEGGGQAALQIVDIEQERELLAAAPVDTHAPDGRRPGLQDAGTEAVGPADGQCTLVRPTDVALLGNGQQSTLIDDTKPGRSRTQRPGVAAPGRGTKPRSSTSKQQSIHAFLQKGRKGGLD